MSKSVMRRVILPVLILLVAVIVFVAMVKMRPEPAKHRPAAPRPVVTAQLIGAESEPIGIRGFGTIRAKRSITLVPQVSGEVLAKSPDFEAGGACRQGQVLLEIDDTDYVLAHERAKADLAQAEFSLATAEEEARIARLQWERLQAGDPDTPEPTTLVLHEPQLKLARAGLESARAAVVQARTNLERCKVRAPFAGRVLAADVDAGQYLRAGTAVGSLYATDMAEVTVSIADEDLAWISVAESGCPAGPRTTVDVAAEFAGAVHHWEGRAVRLGGAVNERNRMVPVVVEIENPFTMQGGRPPLVEGMFVEVTFHADPPAGSVVIPRSALRPGGEVWVVTPDRALDVREVEVARAGLHNAVVTSGLQAGELICTSNLQFVTVGMPVRIEGETMAGDDGSPAPAAAGGDGR